MIQEATAAQVKNGYCGCRVIAVCGEGTGKIIVADPNTNLLHPMTRIPSILYKIHRGKNEIITEVRTNYNRTW